MILRTIKCDICNEQLLETNNGDGFPGWGALHGISLDNVDNPSLCPQCLREIAQHMDAYKTIINGKKQ